MKIRNLSAIALSFVLALGSISLSFAEDYKEDNQPAEEAVTGDMETEEVFAETEELTEEAAEAEETYVPNEAEENKEGNVEFKTIMRAPGRSIGLTDSSLFTNADLASLSASDGDYSYKALLSDDEKKIYDLIDGQLDYNDIVYGTINYSNGTTINTYMDAISVEISDAGIYYDNDNDGWAAAANIGEAYLYDNPEYSWISNVAYGMTITSTDNFVTHEISSLDFQFIAVSDAETVAKNVVVFDAWKDNVVSNASKYTNYYDMLKYAHDALCNQTSYNYDSLEYDSFEIELFRYAHAPLGITTLKKQVVCEGYSKTFKIICDELDIPCLYLTSDIHMWNIVKMEDGEWYGIDVTWDDNDSGSSIHYGYFLKGEGVFSSEPEDRGYYTNPFSFSLSYDDYVLTETTTETTTESTTETTTESTTEPTTVTTTESTTVTTTESTTESTTVTTTESTTETSTETTTETSTESTTVSTTETSTESTTETTTEEEAFVAAPAFKVVGVFGGRNVTFTSDTPEAVIYYSSSTSSITTDDILVQNGETVLYEDYYGTIYARAYYNGSWSEPSKFVLKIPVVNTPTVTANGSKVTIKSTTPSSFICYTTDGTEPVVETDGTLTNGTWLRVNGSRTNSGTITASPGDTVRAAAVRSCFTTSESAAAYVSLSPAAFKVVGTFGGRNVTFTSETEGVKIYYSSETSSLTTSDKCVSNGETVLFENFYGTIYARAYYNGKWSNVSRLILKIPTINDPTITYSGGKATIRTTTPSCYIYYTTDGTTPSITNGKKLSSNSYGQISVSSGTTVKAIAVRSCFTNSSVASYTVS